MNADKMTREEFDRWAAHFDDWEYMSPGRKREVKDMLWSRIQAIQSAPFVPDWSLKPEGAAGFLGRWYMGLPENQSFDPNQPGEFYIPAPSNPTDTELSAMWEKLDRDKRVQIMRDAGAMK